MSFGKMNSFIDISERKSVKDSEGFSFETDVVVASVRGYFEQKNSTQKWINLSQNTEVSALFRIRMSPNIKLTDRHFLICEGKRYSIYSIENIKGRGMYLEILGVSLDG